MSIYLSIDQSLDQSINQSIELVARLIIVAIHVSNTATSQRSIDLTSREGTRQRHHALVEDRVGAELAFATLSQTRKDGIERRAYQEHGAELDAYREPPEDGPHA